MSGNSDFWHEWRGNLDGSRCVMLIRHVFAFRGFRLDLHKFVGADSPGCFHSHPAIAIRLVISGGYVEEFDDGSTATRRPGFAGIVRPNDVHRIARLINGRSSWSLWFRFPKSHEVRLVGHGWRR
jgi:hypothetical protein